MTEVKTSAANDAEAIPPAEPCSIVIFGAAGDLTKRKVMPALFDLSRRGLLDARTSIVGLAVEALSTDDFRTHMRTAMQEFDGDKFDAAAWAPFEAHLSYTSGDFRDPAAYQRLRASLAQVAKRNGSGGNCLFYLATPPSFFGEIVEQLGKAGLVDETASSADSQLPSAPSSAALASGWRRVVIEKPFGHDLDSALALNRQILGVLDERQVYRIDHYLGKETVQNIMVFRFANGIHEPVWNRRYVDHVQITVAETLGVEHRGGYYEHAGALRDMIPSHMFQLLAMAAMEAPTSFDAEALRDEKTKVLRAVRPLSAEEVLNSAVRGQYAAGNVAGRPMIGYRQSPQVAPTSTTETFAALKLSIDNWRWAGVPFYLRTGKSLAAHASEVVVQFKAPPLALFRTTDVSLLEANQLILRIQPQEGIALRFAAKIPGIRVRTGEVNMNFNYADYFDETPFTGYATLLYDALRGDATLFQRADFVAAGWSVVQPVLDAWQSLPPRGFPNYMAGSWGPAEADAMLQRDGRQWRKPQ